jgi:hypothetical protein
MLSKSSTKGLECLASVLTTCARIPQLSCFSALRSSVSNDWNERRAISRNLEGSVPSNGVYIAWSPRCLFTQVSSREYWALVCG